MKEKYNWFFNLYLGILNAKKDKCRDLEELKRQIDLTERWSEQLTGMITLLRACGEIGMDEEEIERNRVIKTFSSVELFDAYVKDGELYVFREVEQ